MDLYCAAKHKSTWLICNNKLDVFPREGEYDYDAHHHNEKLYVGPDSDWEPIAYEGLVQWE